MKTSFAIKRIQSLLVATLLALAPGLDAMAATNSSGNTFSFSPTAIGISASSPIECNPMSNLYKWRGQQDLSLPNANAYDRLSWRSLESSEGAYDFSSIRTAAAAAQRAGQKYSFKVFCMDPLWSHWPQDPGVDVPLYLFQPGLGFFYMHVKADGSKSERTWCPDWNNTLFLQRVQKLEQALSTAFNNDPRIGWIEIGIYGEWAEWHCDHVPYNLAPKKIQPATLATKQTIINAHVASLWNKQLLMETTDKDGLAYAMSLQPSKVHMYNWIGLRRSSLGVSPMFQSQISPSYVSSRWQVAPFVTEFFGPDLKYPISNQLITAQQQVVQCHVSLVSNGNLGSPNNLSNADRANLGMLARLAGFHPILANVTGAYPKAGGQLQIRATWSNLGSAPSYAPWQVQWQLYRSSGGSAVWSGSSTLDVRRLLPGTMVINDSFNLPESLQPGTYTLGLIAQDPQGYYQQPFNVCVQARRSDGSYALGNLQITK